MKKAVIAIAVMIVCGVAFGQETQRQRLEKHLYTLASDSLRGREGGTEDARRAASYIERQWRQMGLKPLFGNSYDSPFTNVYGSFSNLLAVIEGSDPTLKNEYIVLGAHFDHVGVRDDKIYNGADDNASGSSCLLELARLLQARKGELKRSVIICAFDGEEKGLLGSKAMVDLLKSKKMLDNVKLMMSIDMVGWYKANGELVLEGTGTLKKRNDLLKPESLGSDIKVKFKSFEKSIFTATDTEPFAVEGVPTLAVTTGLKSPYHKPEDDADLIDYEGLDRVTDYLLAVTLAVSRQDGTLATGRLARKHSLRHFEVGGVLSYNSGNLSYPDATFVGKTYGGFQGGLTMQYNFNGRFGLRASALYDYSHFMMPVANDAFGKGFGIKQHSLMVPVVLQLSTNQLGISFFIGLGGYYEWSFNGRYYGDVPASLVPYEYGCDPYSIGWLFNFGMRLAGQWQIEGTWYNQLNPLFDPAAAMPKAYKRNYAISLSYWF